MPCLHSLRSWAMHFTFARLRLAGKMIISPRLRLGKIIFIGALINYLSLNNPLITTIIRIPIKICYNLIDSCFIKTSSLIIFFPLEMENSDTFQFELYQSFTVIKSFPQTLIKNENNQPIIVKQSKHD